MPDESKQPSWIEQASAILETAETDVPVPTWLQIEALPQWAGNAAGAIIKAAMPGTAWKEPKRWTPGDLGAFLGGKTVYWKAESDEENYDPLWLKRLAKPLKTVEERNSLAAIVRYFRKLWRVGYPQYLNALIQCFALVADAPHQEKIRFFKAYTKAIAQRQNSDGSPARSTTATPIYSFLLIRWRAVEQLESISKLHSVLCTVFGSATIGDLKRVEKICERIGLSFAKAAKAKEMPSATDKPA